MPSVTEYSEQNSFDCALCGPFDTPLSARLPPARTLWGLSSMTQLPLHRFTESLADEGWFVKRKKIDRQGVSAHKKPPPSQRTAGAPFIFLTCHPISFRVYAAAFLEVTRWNIIMPTTRTRPIISVMAPGSIMHRPPAIRASLKTGLSFP